MTTPMRPVEIINFAASMLGRQRWSRFRRSLTRNTGLKLLSVGLAVALWLFVNTGQHQSEMSLDIPISYNALPARLLIVNHHPRFVKLDIVGPRTLLSLVDPGRLTLRLDLAGVNQGQASFRVSAEMFNLPRQIVVTRISPSQIVLDIDKIVTRDVPVSLNLVGSVTRGYTIAGSGITPAEVAATGPSQLVNSLKKLNTETLNVAGLAADFDGAVQLVDPGPRIHLARYEVEARIALKPVIVNREYKDVKVGVRNTDRKADVQPAEVSIVVRGPFSKLSKFEPDQVVYVEAGGLMPGVHMVPVMVVLPDGLELVRQTPQRVRLRLYREKRAAGGP